MFACAVRYLVCVCVCVCARARACVCACMLECVREREREREREKERECVSHVCIWIYAPPHISKRTHTYHTKNSEAVADRGFRV